MFLAVRDLTFARGRFGLMATVVGLITFLVVLLSGLAAGLGNKSVSAVQSLPADHLAFQRPAVGRAISFDESSVTRAEVGTWQARPGVTDAALLGISPTRLAERGRELSVTLFAATPGSFIAPPDLVAGSEPAVVLGPKLLETSGAVAGGTVTLAGHEFRVVAGAADPSFNHMPVAWIGLEQWKTWGGGRAAATGDGTVIALRTSGDVDIAAGDASAGTTTTTITGAFAAVGSYTAENGSLTLIRVLLFAVSALVVGAFFTVWTIQRTPDLAVLKAMGATSGYLVKDSLTQAAFVLGIGTVAGTVAATGLGLLAAGAVPFVISAATTVFPLSVTLVVGLVGALAAVRSIVSVDPLTALGASR